MFIQTDDRVTDLKHFQTCAQADRSSSLASRKNTVVKASDSTRDAMMRLAEVRSAARNERVITKTNALASTNVAAQRRRERSAATNRRKSFTSLTAIPVQTIRVLQCVLRTRLCSEYDFSYSPRVFMCASAPHVFLRACAQSVSSRGKTTAQKVNALRRRPGGRSVPPMTARARVHTYTMLTYTMWMPVSEKNSLKRLSTLQANNL